MLILSVFPWLFVFCVIFSCLLRLSNISTVLGLSLPPGPKAPWFGVLSLPSAYPWLVYAKWKEIYGDIIYLRILGNPVMVLNSASAVADLLEKRGSIYSSRPIRTMVVELIGWDWLFSAMASGDRWKRHRNVFRKHFRPNGSPHYGSVQIKETHALLRSLLHSPDDFRHHVRSAAAATILNLTYGHDVADQGNNYAVLADKAIAGLAAAGIFGTYLVDYLPILKHLPYWFPFATFKRKAYKWRISTTEMVNRPFEMVKNQMTKGTATPCLVVSELDKQAEDEDVIRNVAATAFAAGADTVVSAILSFFLAMTINPEAQKKAQDEIDHVTGSKRLPNLSDKPNLPLVESICYELLRWNPVTPLGLAHYVTENDEYKGYHIPKGTTVLPNVWAILHDPQMYPDPLTFQAQRFLDIPNSKAGINEKPDAAFGFGRRICPGRWFAFDFLFIVVASTLSTYDVSKATDDNGKPIEPQVKYSSLLLSHPLPFKCEIRPRSSTCVSLIEQTAVSMQSLFCGIA